ncbi:hypothetical protein Agabi119p4_5175 [Agaricus bisporus var. burnettii]|uniref:Translation initiation factor 3 N-terminal domain-containing protein n=1 Tax=Agaricus bisporus var. burnettii TaxID=192524 RepID=A0A8H7F4N5_AGABI|nr:hypothetical protein Agabi119p4_5175 [Agaricus bisporus var. burnettii]
MKPYFLLKKRCSGIRILKHEHTPPFLSSTSRYGVIKPTSRETHRAFHFTVIRRAYDRNDQPPVRKETEKERKAKEAKAREIGLRGRNIPYDIVRVRHQGALSNSRRLSDVLEEVDSLNLAAANEAQHTEDLPLSSSKIKKKYVAELVVNKPSPIVAIIDTKAAFEKQKRRHEQVKNSSVHNVRKEIQLTWATSPADVETKLERMKDDLQKGYRIDLAISPKQGTPVPQLAKMQERVEEIVSQVAELAREWQGREYTKNTAVVYLQGIPVPSSSTEKDAKRAPKRALLKQERREKEEERRNKKKEWEASRFEIPKF